MDPSNINNITKLSLSTTSNFNSLFNLESHCEKQQLLQYNDEIQQQCIVLQSPIFPNVFQFKDFKNQMNLKNLIISKYFGVSNLGYLRDEWVLVSVLLFSVLPVVLFLFSNKYINKYLISTNNSIKRQYNNHFNFKNNYNYNNNLYNFKYNIINSINSQYLNEKSLNQLYHSIIRGIICLYLTISCFLNMINKTYQENLNFIVLSFLIFKLTDIVLLSLNRSNDKLLYLRNIITFFFLYSSIYLDKEGLKYIYLLIFDEFLYVINVTFELLQILKINSNYKFLVSMIGLCFLSMTVIPKQIWIIYDSTLINPFNLATLLITLSLIIVIILELLYSLKYIKEIVNTYSKVSF